MSHMSYPSFHRLRKFSQGGPDIYSYGRDPYHPYVLLFVLSMFTINGVIFPGLSWFSHSKPRSRCSEPGTRFMQQHIYTLIFEPRQQMLQMWLIISRLITKVVGHSQCVVGFLKRFHPNIAYEATTTWAVYSSQSLEFGDIRHVYALVMWTTHFAQNMFQLMTL